MNNNNENNNEELNAVSLGSFDNNSINDIPPVMPEEPMDTLEELPNNLEQATIPDVVNNEVIADVSNQADIPNVPPLEPVAPVNYDIPEVIDNAPVFNDIGTVPPINDIPVINNVIAEPATPEPSKKKGVNKTLFVVLIILALCAVGGGVYVFLNKANNSQPLVQTRNVKIEVGSEVSTNIKDYAIFNKMDSSTCNFDTSEITDTNIVGAEYRFTITCEDKTYPGRVTIVDTTAPEVTLREVEVSINEEVNAEDFIAECKDATKCSYAFKDEEKLKEYLSTVSSYHIPIIVKDEAGNETEVTGTLNVSENAATMSLVCSKIGEGYEEVSKFGLLESDNTFNKSTKRVYTFKFDEKSEYEKLRDENKDKKEITYQNITGAPEFNDETLTLTLTKKIAYSDLVSEVGSEIPSSYGELKEFFEQKDYSCSIGYF